MSGQDRKWLTRRDACRTLGSVAFAGLLPPQELRGDEKSSVTFGFSLYGMKLLSVANSLKACADIGYNAVELCCMRDWVTAPENLEPGDRKAIRKGLLRHKLQLPALMENLPLLVEKMERIKHLDRIKAAGELGHELAPDSSPVLETIMGGKPDDWPRVQNEMVDELGKWSEAAASVKTVMAVNPHVSGAVHTPEAADWLIRQVDSPWIRLAYDFSHYAVRSIDMQQSLDLLLPHTVFVHVKDSLGKDGKVEFGLPGEGTTDYAAYFKTLQKANYRGSVMVEISSQLWRQELYDPINAAKASFDNLKPALVESGLW